jgi:hypothetical protein
MTLVISMPYGIRLIPRLNPLKRFHCQPPGVSEPISLFDSGGRMDQGPAVGGSTVPREAFPCAILSA